MKAQGHHKARRDYGQGADADGLLHFSVLMDLSSCLLSVCCAAGAGLGSCCLGGMKFGSDVSKEREVQNWTARGFE